MNLYPSYQIKVTKEIILLHSILIKGKVALYTALRKRSPMVTTSYSNSFTIIYQHNIVMLVQKIRENCFDHLKV